MGLVATYITNELNLGSLTWSMMMVTVPVSVANRSKYNLTSIAAFAN